MSKRKRTDEEAVDEAAAEPDRHKRLKIYDERVLHLRVNIGAQESIIDTAKEQIEELRGDLADARDKKAAAEFDVKVFVEQKAPNDAAWLLDPYLIRHMDKEQLGQLQQAFGGWYPVRIRWDVGTERSPPSQVKNKDWEFDDSPCYDLLWYKKSFEEAKIQLNVDQMKGERAKAHVTHLDPYDHCDSDYDGDGHDGVCGSAFVKSWAILVFKQDTFFFKTRKPKRNKRHFADVLKYTKGKFELTLEHCDSDDDPDPREDDPEEVELTEREKQCQKLFEEIQKELDHMKADEHFNSIFQKYPTIADITGTTPEYECCGDPKKCFGVGERSPTCQECNELMCSEHVSSWGCCSVRCAKEHHKPKFVCKGDETDSEHETSDGEGVCSKCGEIVCDEHVLGEGRGEQEDAVCSECYGQVTVIVYRRSTDAETEDWYKDLADKSQYGEFQAANLESAEFKVDESLESDFLEEMEKLGYRTERDD
jgi:hypothetical protein